MKLHEVALKQNSCICMQGSQLCDIFQSDNWIFYISEMQWALHQIYFLLNIWDSWFTKSSYERMTSYFELLTRRLNLGFFHLLSTLFLHLGVTNKLKNKKIHFKLLTGWVSLCFHLKLKNKQFRCELLTWWLNFYFSTFLASYYHELEKNIKLYLE